jgi:hypothetical protein
MLRLAPRATSSGVALTRAQAFLDPEILGRDLDRALDPGRDARPAADHATAY